MAAKPELAEGVLVWEKLLHQVLHTWEGSRTDERSPTAKAKQADVNPSNPLESEGLLLLRLSNLRNSYFHHVFRGLFFFSTSGLPHHDIIKMFYI